MKKISMMNTTSSIGVKSISASSESATRFLLRIESALLMICGQVVCQKFAFTLGNSGYVGVRKYA